MKVKELKEILQESIDTLNNFNNDDNITLHSNTMCLGYPNYFIAKGGDNGGFIALDWLKDEIEKNNK